MVAVACFSAFTKGTETARLCHLFGRLRHWIGDRHDHICLDGNELADNFGETLEFALCRATLQNEVGALRVFKIGQCMHKALA